MRIRLTKSVTVFIVILNLTALYFIWNLIYTHGGFNHRRKHLQNKPVLNNIFIQKKERSALENKVTFVIRSFEPFENDLADTIKSILQFFINASIFIVTETPVYPPIPLDPYPNNVKIVNLKTTLMKSFKEKNPILQIISKYVLFVPDSTRFTSKKIIDKLVNISKANFRKSIAVPYKGSNKIQCLSIKLDIREWVIRFFEFPHAKDCDLVKGKHALFVETEVLFNVSDSLMLPFPDSLYIQLSVESRKVR